MGWVGWGDQNCLKLIWARSIHSKLSGSRATAQWQGRAGWLLHQLPPPGSLFWFSCSKVGGVLLCLSSESHVSCQELEEISHKQGDHCTCCAITALGAFVLHTLKWV